jgi:hypothetical protein
MRIIRGFRNGNFVHFSPDDGGSGNEGLAKVVTDEVAGAVASVASGKGAEKAGKPAESEPELTAEAKFLVRSIVEGVTKGLATVLGDGDEDDGEDEAPKRRKRRAPPTPPPAKKTGIFGISFFKKG